MINADFMMLSGSLDSQTSDDVFDVNEFELPNPSGKSGGACTSALLKVLYNNKNKKIKWVWLLNRIKFELKKLRYDQIPQLSSSKEIDSTSEIELITSQQGIKKALLIGINYTGQKGELFGCHNDIRNVKNYLIDIHNFNEDQMIILLDDGLSIEPTRTNIENAFIKLTDEAKNGDVIWIHYAGHGERTKDQSRDEKSGVDSTLVPKDFRLNGVITDDDIYKLLVEPMPKNVHVSIVTDCCHSGTLLDLPYTYKS
jgi:hypothetical protein